MNKFANRNDINELDFSSIISASSIASNKTINQSISNNSIVADNYNRESTNFIAKNDHTSMLVNSEISLNIDNVDLNHLDYLNQEFVELGLESIISNRSNKVDFSLVFKNSIESLERLKRQLILNDRIQEKSYKLDRENELYLKRQDSLKEANEVANRELGNLEEKFRQSQLKINLSNKSIKDLNEENRKLQCIIEQRDSKYKHERKKFEKEIEKLKERIQLLTTGKTKDLPHLDLSETVFRNSFGPRQTWNTDNSSTKKQLELYTELIKDYDFKTKELTIENTDLKSFIANIYSNLSKASNLNRKDTIPAENETFLTDITRLPFENTFLKLNKEIEQKFKIINELLTGKDYQQQSPLSSSNVDKQLNTIRQAAANLTISSINSVDDENIDRLQTRTKKFTHNKDDILNATFTIEDTSDNDEEDDINDIVKASNECIEHMEKFDFLDECKNLDQFDFVNSLNQIKSSRKSDTNKNNGQALSFSSSSSSSSSASTSFNNSEQKCELYSNSNTKIKNEAKKHRNSENRDTAGLTEEKIKIAQEKKHLLEQKLKLENEMISFHKISNELAKQQKDFRDEQEDFYESKLLSSFIEQSKSNSKK